MQVIRAIFFLFTISTSFFIARGWYLQHKISVKTAHQQKKLVPHNKKDITFLWDLHDVVFEHTMKDRLSIIWQYDRLGAAFKNLDYNTLSVIGRYFLKILYLIRAEVTSAELLYYAQKANNTAFVDLVLRIAQAEKPIAGTVSIIEQLTKDGYAQDVGSNIGNLACDALAEKFPDIFAHFKNRHVIAMENDKLVSRKPAPSYFTRYMERYNKKASHIIFIDDKKENIAAAQSLGIIGLLFTSPEQLQADLETLGIFEHEKQAETQKGALAAT